MPDPYFVLMPLMPHFFGKAEAGQREAILYTIVESCLFKR